MVNLILHRKTTLQMQKTYIEMTGMIFSSQLKLILGILFILP